MSKNEKPAPEVEPAPKAPAGVLARAAQAYHSRQRQERSRARADRPTVPFPLGGNVCEAVEYKTGIRTQFSSDCAMLVYVVLSTAEERTTVVPKSARPDVARLREGQPFLLLYAGKSMKPGGNMPSHDVQITPMVESEVDATVAQLEAFEGDFKTLMDPGA